MVGYLLLCSILIFNTQPSSTSKMKKFSDIYLCHLVYSVLDLFSKVKFNEMLKYKSFIFEKAIDILNNYTIENSK